MIHKAGTRRPRVPAVVATCVALFLAAGCAPAPEQLRLADGTEVFFLSNTKVQPANSYPEAREIKIDGEAFIRAPAAAQPLTIRSRLMVLTVTGRTALRVTARSKETGEEADVLYGHVVATKAYPSRQNEPDTLLAGEEVMVNETIDLQEKETTDLASLRSWSDSLMASVDRKLAR
jgi:ferric-dicitrate binding protein FerR (iron transport regulator)